MSESDDWMSVYIVAPPEDMWAVLEYLKIERGWPEQETDWCESERDDFALYSYGPVEPITRSRYGG